MYWHPEAKYTRLLLIAGVYAEVEAIWKMIEGESCHAIEKG
jgi:hypothetical protein